MTAWLPEPYVVRRFASDAVFIGDWECPGDRSRTVVDEVSHHFEIALQHVGSQVRETGRERTIADLAHVVVQYAGDEYRLTHPAPRLERSVIMLVSSGVLDELRDDRLGFASRGVPLSSRAALARYELARALASGDALAGEDAALGLLEILAGDDAARGDRAEAPARDRALVEAIQHELARRYRDDVALDDIARAVKVSPWHASRVFRRTLGIPMRRYLVRLRVFAALEALDARRGEWTRLALEVGFASHSHFTDAFVRELGVAPSRAMRRNTMR